jgi:hypothetical protein
MAHHDDTFKLHSPEFSALNRKLDRRDFLLRTASGLGAMALGFRGLILKPGCLVPVNKNYFC